MYKYSAPYTPLFYELKAVNGPVVGLPVLTYDGDYGMQHLILHIYDSKNIRSLHLYVIEKIGYASDINLTVPVFEKRESNFKTKQCNNTNDSQYLFRVQQEPKLLR